MTCVDSNVLIDVLDDDPIWFAWSAAALNDAVGVGSVWVNPIVVGELSRGFDTIGALLSQLSAWDVEVSNLDPESAFMAGKRFQAFRRLREAGEVARVLPDFLIGAHALVLDQPLLTRDPRLYRRYFPELNLITPETQP